MRARALATLVAVVIPCFAFGDFEGVLDSKMTGENMNGTVRTWISKVGIRSEMNLQMPEAGKAAGGGAFKTVTIVKSAQPTIAYMVDDHRKTYSVIESKPGAKQSSKETYAVKRLGKDRIGGFSCDKVSLTSSDGDDYELCVAPDLLAGPNWANALQHAGDQDDGVMRSLTKAGVKGMPILWVRKGKPGAFRLELVSAQKRSVPASTFDIPVGYTKSELAMPGMTPQMSKQMEESMKHQREALENLPPEQRKQLEEMMKKYGGGQ